MTPLRARREHHGWTKTQLDTHLRRAAKARGETLPSPESLARQFARWENGHGPVGPFYQQLFCDVYGCSPVELGFIDAPETVEPEPTEELAAELARAKKVKDQAHQLVRTVMHDARLGKAIELDQVEPVVQNITESIMRNPGALVGMLRIKNKDDYTFLHSVSVCTLLVAFSRSIPGGSQGSGSAPSPAYRSSSRPSTNLCSAVTSCSAPSSSGSM